MNALIKIMPRAIGNLDLVQTINARELHEFLGVRTAFKDWISRRISEFGFKDGQDFCSFLSETTGGRPSTEYALTLDMGKELSMVERNEKGKQARLYFIDCERKARSYAVDPMQALSDPTVLRGLLLGYSEKVTALEGKVTEMAPQVQAFARIAVGNGSFSITEAAKDLQVKPHELFKWLRSHGWIYRRAGSASDLGYQDKVSTGYLEHKVTTVARTDGSEKYVTQVRITPKGMARLAKEFGKGDNPELV